MTNDQPKAPMGDKVVLQEYIIPLMRGRVAYLNIPKDVTYHDIDIILGYLSNIIQEPLLPKL